MTVAGSLIAEYNHARFFLCALSLALGTEIYNPAYDDRTLWRSP